MNDDGEDDDHDGGWPKCSGDPSEAELSPGTLRRAVISQVTLVWFPTNTSAIPFYPLHHLQGHRRWTRGLLLPFSWHCLKAKLFWGESLVYISSYMFFLVPSYIYLLFNFSGWKPLNGLSFILETEIKALSLSASV